MLPGMVDGVGGCKQASDKTGTGRCCCVSCVRVV